MSSDAPKHTLGDLMAEAVSPAFIVALVGSLVFFLVEVLYVGRYSGNLLWGLFFFVFAAVLIARIATDSPAKARGYALLLAVPVWLTLQFYVEYPPETPLADFKALVNLALMALIWWCAHRLTWDCTFVDEEADVTGTGLLQAAGLENSAPAAEGQADPPEDTAAGQARLSWWERYRRYREERRKKHTPGVWVVYFSLAALPLFGLGQSLIPVQDEGRRRYVFWLMVVYVASGLGLLLTTTFLGLRHYLRQRQVKMPAAATGVWLTMGGGLVVALLALGALLPRPQAEYPLVDLARLGSPERGASRFAVKDGAPGKGEGRPSSAQPPADQKDEGQSGDRGRSGGQRGQGSEPKNGSSNGGNKDASGKGDQAGRQGDSRGNSQSRQGDGRGSGQDRAGGKEPNARGNSGGKSGQRDPAQKVQGEHRDGGGGRGQQDQGKDGRPSQQQAPAPGEQRPGSSGPSFLAVLWAVLAALGPVLKWVVYLVFIALVAFVVLRAVLQFLANFTTWARDLLKALRAWWENLFGRRGGQGADEGAAGEVVPATPPRPFASYTNPFADGSAGRLSPEKLVRYTFEAFQAWAWEHHLGRRPDETPLEFAGRVGVEVPGLEADAQRLATLYARVLYARGPLPGNARAAVEQFWSRLEAVVEQPLSA